MFDDDNSLQYGEDRLRVDTRSAYDTHTVAVVLIEKQL